MSFEAKHESVRNRQLKVQRLVLGFSITGNATPASVAITRDEPSLLFVKTEGVDQITGALAAGETATYTVSPVDADGTVNFLINVRDEEVSKVVACHIHNRVTGILEPCKLGDADGLSSEGKIMLTMDSATALNAANTIDGALIVEYIVQD